MSDLDLPLTYIMPVPTCCKLYAHNYTCIQKNIGWRGTLDPTGQLVILLKKIKRSFVCFIEFL